MGFTDFILAVPLGIIQYIFIFQVLTIINNELYYGEKFQRFLIMAFIFGILLMVIGNTFFKKNKKMKNKIMQYGLTLTGILLILYSSFSNWSNMYDSTKLIIFGFILSGFIWYIYSSNTSKPKRDIFKELEEEQKIMNNEDYEDYEDKELN